VTLINIGTSNKDSIVVEMKNNVKRFVQEITGFEPCHQ
jgi:hypothetical protein